MMNLIVKLLVVAVLSLSIFLAWFWQTMDQFRTTAVSFVPASIDFVIAPGSSVSTVANSLAAQGLVSDAKYFLWMIKLDEQESQIKAGEYVLQSGMNPREIADRFIIGKVKQYAFTIIEGWNFSQLLTALEKNQKLRQTLANKSDDEIMEIIGYPGEHPEGRFLPDTYFFPANSSDKQLLQRAHNALEKILEMEWANRQENLPLIVPYDALILASIVEKETGVAEERKKIAGVFIRRLEKKMRLQTDPTVIYGMNDSYTGNLRKKDLKKDTPYNTYRRKGLTPTPIALAGKSAIHAALNPDVSESLYFVAKGDGSHYFSATIKEHNQAVRKYQILQRDANYRSSPLPSSSTR